MYYAMYAVTVNLFQDFDIHAGIHWFATYSMKSETDWALKFT